LVVQSKKGARLHAYCGSGLLSFAASVFEKASVATRELKTSAATRGLLVQMMCLPFAIGPFHFRQSWLQVDLQV
jgi:hypothetical protein